MIRHRIVKPAAKHGSWAPGSQRTHLVLLVTTQCLGVIASGRTSSGTAVLYSNGADFPRALVPLSAQIRRTSVQPLWVRFPSLPSPRNWPRSGPNATNAMHADERPGPPSNAPRCLPIVCR